MPTRGHGSSGEASLCLLVIQQDAYDWQTIIQSAVAAHDLGGVLPRIEVVQTAWDDIDVGAVENDRYHEGALFNGLSQRYIKFPVTVSKQWKDGKPVVATGKDANRPVTIFPNFVLVRNCFNGQTKSFRNQLLALIYADCPSINSLQSILLAAEKPVLQGALHRLWQTKYMNRPFDLPLLPQTFAPAHTSFFYGRPFPAVVKFGSAHAGFGKLRVPHHHDMDDVRTMLPMTRDQYCTAEPFINGAGDLRLQKIGDHYRAFFRRSTCGAWKTNTQSAVLTEIPVTPIMVEWMEAASTMLGRDARNKMHILTIDAIVEAVPEDAERDPTLDETPEEVARIANPHKAHILEVNDTSSGLSPDTAAEDNLLLADLVLDTLGTMLGLNNNAPPLSPL
jgi:hypothetical protein